MKRFAFIALRAPGWPVRQQYQLPGVSPSGYYAWRKRVPVAAAEQTLGIIVVAEYLGHHYNTQRLFSCRIPLEIELHSFLIHLSSVSV